MPCHPGLRERADRRNGGTSDVFPVRKIGYGLESLLAFVEGQHKDAFGSIRNGFSIS
jgi:hypothetical protein